MDKTILAPKASTIFSQPAQLVVELEIHAAGDTLHNMLSTAVNSYHMSCKELADYAVMDKYGPSRSSIARWTKKDSKIPESYYNCIVVALNKAREVHGFKQEPDWPEIKLVGESLRKPMPRRPMFMASPEEGLETMIPIASPPLDGWDRLALAMSKRMRCTMTREQAMERALNLALEGEEKSQEIT